MQDGKLTETEAISAFWDHLRNRTTVMLGSLGPGQHTQPMTAFSEPEEDVVWFFTRDDTDLAVEAADGTEARLILMSPDKEVYADVSGTLRLAKDRARIDRYWNPMVAAWYPDGKDDPHLIMMRFVPHDGQIWVSKQGFVRLIFQVTKANLTKTPPNVGGTADVNFKH